MLVSYIGSQLYYIGQCFNEFNTLIIMAAYTEEFRRLVWLVAGQDRHLSPKLSSD